MSLSHRIPWAWMFLFFLAALSACRMTSNKEVKIVGADADGTTITLRPGQTLIVRLAANPTTGYEWALAEVDPQILRQVTEPGFTPSSGARVGAGGVVEWRFQAQKEGATILRLVYRRPFEPDAPPAQTLTLMVEVR